MCKIEVKHEGDSQIVKIRRIRADAGRKGGLAKVPKGFAKMNPERRREIAIKASKRAAELRSAKKGKNANGK